MYIKPVDNKNIRLAKERWLSLAKPLHSLGKLEDAVTKLCGIYGNDISLDKRALTVMCGDNGVVEEGVTQCSSSVTAIVAGNFSKGMTTACIMAEKARCDVFAYDMGINTDVEGIDRSKKVMYGTGNICREKAMEYSQAEECISAGIEIVKELKEKGYKIICTGEMGIGNTTTAAAVTRAITGIEAEKITGRGAGLDSEGLERKIKAVKKAIDINFPFKDTVDIISKVGGTDIGALTGIFLGGGIYGVPVVIDGFISAAAALCAYNIDKNVLDYMLPSHGSAEKGCGIILEHLGISPLIECNMFVGEGCGALALLPLLDMAVSVFEKMCTFENINMERYSEKI